MRTSLAAVSTLLLVTQTGCSYDFCLDYVGKAGCDGAGGSVATASGDPSSSSTSSVSTSGSSTTGVSATCTPSDPTWAPSDDCGVFVSAGAMGIGTKDSPFGALTDAVASGRAIYVSEGTYENAVALPAGTVLFGGLKPDWTFDAAVRPTITAPADQIPVRLSAGTITTELHHLRIEAKPAEAGGGSSIALLVDDVPSVLNGVDLVAGNARGGADSETPNDDIGPDNPNDPTIKGKDGKTADSMSVTTALGGGASVANPSCPTSVGGKGGDGGTLSGAMEEDAGDGSGGAVFDAACSGMTCGRGGPGADEQGQAQCASGQAGRNGANGDNGVAATTLGALTVDGYVAPAPGDAMPGVPGQGGGGGGGEQGAGTAVPPRRGASGSSGGAGGCGGHGAAGGGSGGSSIALVLLGQTPEMTLVTLTVGDAGTGGDGAPGQPGVPGGNAGEPGLGAGGSLAGCPGGRGGQGGNGGHGAGGRGGHAAGIAFNGDAPATGFTVLARGVAGMGGTSSGNAGVSGDSQDVLDFVP